MREESNAVADAGSMREGSRQTGLDITSKFRVAMVLYAVLAALSWFTLDGKISVGGKLVELRLIPLVIIGGLTLRTIVALNAEKIRREGQ
jgi:hypothetical protein